MTSPSVPSDAPVDEDPWWRTAVVYQIYPRSFADGNGDGVGDLPGILERLDHLVALGVDVVWLSPFYRSPMDDNGYDISDYRSVDPLFGSLADFDALVAAVHARGMKLVTDLVLNHTSDEHPWFVESRSSRTSAKRDWYWWRSTPTGWESFFSGSAWELDPATDEYYLHLFSRKQPDLNWENPEVRQAVHAMMRWWLDRGVDGFRLDVINMISKEVGPDGSLPEGPATFLNGPRIHEFLAEMYAETMAGRNLITVGEMPDSTVEDARLYTDPARHELDMVFTFEHVDLDRAPGGSKWDLAPLHLPDLKANLAAWQEGLADVGWNSLYWNNHDQPRVVSRWGDDGEHRVESAKTLGTTLHLLRGTPYVYQGEELGMTNAHWTSVEPYRDIESVNWATEALAHGTAAGDVVRSLATKSRDNARTPMQWSAGPQAGFTTGTPWLPVNPNHVVVNADAARADPASVFHHYRRLIELRHTVPIVVSGRFRLLAPGHEQLFAYVRELPSQTLLVVANWSSGVLPVADLLGDSAGLLSGDLLLGTHPARGTAEPLLPWESRIVLTATGGGHDAVPSVREADASPTSGSDAGDRPG